MNSYFSDYDFHDYYPNNRINNNRVGFAARWGSYIYAGKGIGDGCWNNSIYRNEYFDVQVIEKSYVMAQYNIGVEKDPLRMLMKHRNCMQMKY